MTCALCKLERGFKVAICRTCGELLIVSYDHKQEFSEIEKARIEVMFPGAKIRWEMIQIKGHAHCHLEIEK